MLIQVETQAHAETSPGKACIDSSQPPNARNATHSSGVSCPCAGHWPPSKLWAVVISTAPSTGYPDWSAASLAAALAERLLVFAGSPESSQQPVHHWHSL